MEATLCRMDSPHRCAEMKWFKTESNSKLHVRVKSYSSTHFAGCEGT